MAWLAVVRSKYVTSEHGCGPCVVITILLFPRSLLTIRLLTRVRLRVSLVEQELFTLLEHLSLTPVFYVHFIIFFFSFFFFFPQCLVFCGCVMFVFLSLFAIVLSVLLRIISSGDPFGIFKLFFFCCFKSLTFRC